VLKNFNFSNFKNFSSLGNGIPEEETFFFPPGMKLTGEISGDCKGRIDGHFSGKINISGKLIIGKDASVFGFIFANEIIIYGNIQGEIYSKGKVTIMNGSVIHGDIFANNFLVEEKSIVEGNLKKQTTEDLVKIFAAKFKHLGLNNGIGSASTQEGELLLSMAESNSTNQESSSDVKPSPVLPQYKVNNRWF
jgi:cytoskeletal protein CcmA (bactofilin family)